SAAVETMLADLATNAGLYVDEAFGSTQAEQGERDDSSPAVLPERFEILIKCADESQQATLLERLLAEGLECRALIC
ncbi:MAG TPA: hypothetical protein VMR25_22940, partial [Planctomycetaceae bacterium]|nr:hypothetical protein [Planctomycetaceae bacterium]